MDLTGSQLVGVTGWWRLLFVVCMFLCPLKSEAQGIGPKEWQAIQKNPDYIIGMGMSNSLETSRQMAQNDLASKISTKVESQFDYLINQKTEGKNVTSSSKMENIMRSYSSVTLNNVSEYIAKEKGQIVVYRYMKNSDLRSMFRRRANLARKWAREAADREREGKIGDALQNYYWSLALLRSCPNGDLEELGEDMTMKEAFQRVKDILSEISVKAVSVEKDATSQNVTLAVTYKGKPAVNFNYKYSPDGKTFSSVYTVKDGAGLLELPANAKTSKLKIYAEYECREEANIHPDLYSVMESTDPVPFKEAVLMVDAKECTQQSADYEMQISKATPPTSSTVSEAPTSQTPQELNRYLPTMQRIEKAMNQHDYSTLRDCFTESGWDMFSKLVAYGDARLLRSPEVQFFQDRDLMVCRSFPMSFTFKNNRRKFTEDVVFYLDASGKVCEVAFGLEQVAVNDIMNRGDWSLEARQVMIHFLETYKTAYALKRFEYINSIFSNEALIITGSIVKATGQKEMNPAKMQHVKYTRQTKEQYMANLKKCFAGNEYINIHFADNVVRRSHTKPDIYGIQIKQDYFSSSYGDTGYLFLLIDFSNPDAPLIHVRTWQPDNDPNIRDGRIGIADFLL